MVEPWLGGRNTEVQQQLTVHVSPRSKSHSRFQRAFGIAAMVGQAVALFDFDARNGEEISLRRGQKVDVLEAPEGKLW